MKTSYQLLRIIACISASFYLFLDFSGIGSFGTVWTLIQNILISYVPLFFMLSGRFILEKYEGKLWRFYKNRIIKIVIPFLIASFMALIAQIGFSVSLGFAKDYVKGVCGGSIEEMYSFMYGLFVFYLVAPFLSVMVKALSEKERRMLVGILIGYFAFFALCVVLNLRLFIVSYPFLNNIGYALLGYLIDHISLKEKEYKGILVAGTVALLISCAEAVLCPDLNWALDSYCLTRVLMCLAFYLFVTRRKIPEGKTARGINAVGKSTYYIALALPILLRLIWG